MKITTISDYYEQIYKQFPDVPKQDIKRILKYGWKALYLHNSYGGDTIMKDKNFWCYIGTLTSTPLQHYTYYIRKLVTRFRVLYKRRHIKWDGYYYFTLSEKAYQNYLKQKNKVGRKRKKFNYGNVFLYLMKDECRIKQAQDKYIFRVPYITKMGFKLYARDYISDRAELIEIRQPLKFKDILTHSNKYDLI